MNLITINRAVQLALTLFLKKMNLIFQIIIIFEIISINRLPLKVIWELLISKIWNPCIHWFSLAHRHIQIKISNFLKILDIMKFQIKLELFILKWEKISNMKSIAKMINKKIVSTKMVTNFRWFLLETDQIRKKIILKSFARQSEILKVKKLLPNLLL